MHFKKYMNFFFKSLVCVKLDCNLIQNKFTLDITVRDARRAPPCPGENGCPGPENFQDCPASPRKCPEFNFYPALPKPEIFFLYPALACPEAKKGCPVHYNKYKSYNF